VEQSQQLAQSMFLHHSFNITCLEEKDRKRRRAIVIVTYPGFYNGGGSQVVDLEIFTRIVYNQGVLRRKRNLKLVRASFTHISRINKI